jgi:hypothetical protein
VQHLSPWGWCSKHTLSRLAHNVLVTFLLVEAHAEFDTPISPHNLFPWVYGGALRHRYHHACSHSPGEADDNSKVVSKGKGEGKGDSKGKGKSNSNGNRPVHFQQFFRFMDQLAGLEVSEAECRRAKTYE